MEATKYMRYILISLAAISLLCGCAEDEKMRQTEFNMRVDETVSIQLPQSSSYTITTDKSVITYELSGRQLTVAAIKEGKATLTAILDSGESLAYSFTVTANAYQLGFTIDSTPRVESWIGTSVKTEETPSLQVSCEPGIDITGSATDQTTRSYGFIYIETGKLFRFSAQGDFSQKGELSNGIAAMCESANERVQYESCTVTIEKINDEGKIWFTLQFADRSDIRVVTESF